MKRAFWLLLFLVAPSLYAQGPCILIPNTASQEISIGPFVDETDGFTSETGLTIANTDVRLKKNGADWAAKNSGGATHEEFGNYRITLDATDTNAVGLLEIAVHVAGARPVRQLCNVGLPGTILHGTAQSATGTTIVLASATSLADDRLNGMLISILSGTGAGQTRVITDYVDSTDTATVATWTTTPGSDSVYIVTPFPVLSTATEVGTSVWATTTRQLTGTQTFNVTGNVTGNLSGSVGSVTGAVGSVTSGVYYLKTNTATTGDRIHFIPYASNGDPTKNASGVACQISLDGGAPTTIADTPTEVEFTTGAYWKFDLSQANTNGNAAMIMCTGTGMQAAPIAVEFQH